MASSSVCLFNCPDLKCPTKNVFSFTNVICINHLKKIFGLNLWLFRSETAMETSLAGPFLIVDQDLEFETNTVVFPERDYLDSYLFPRVDQMEYNNYKLNPRLKHYLDLINSRNLGFKNADTYKVHLELIRNLSLPKIAHDTINIAGNDDDTTHGMLKGEIAAKLNVLTNWVTNEPYYKVFDKLTVIDEPDGPEIPITKFSTFYAFMLFNCIYDRHEFQTPKFVTPITCYANLKYVKGIGFVTVQNIPNPLPLTVIGRSKSSISYYNVKTKSIPNVVTARNVDSRDFPDNNRIQNVIGDNQNYCRIKGMPTLRL